MGDFQHKPNSASLFRNDRKDKDTQPDYKGDGLINGVEVWLSAWINETSAGKKYFGIRFEEKEQQTANQAAAQDFDDDIPF